MERFSEFCRNLTKEHNRKRLMFDGVNRFWSDVLWNFSKLSDSEKINWFNESLLIVEKNRDSDLIGSSIKLLAISIEGRDELFKLLKKSPHQSKNRWNELILIELVNKRFLRLANETSLINQVIKYFPTDLIVLDFMLKYACLNQQFALNHICDLIVKSDGTPKLLEYYGNKIYSMLYAVEKSLPIKLIACAKQNGVDISNIKMYSIN